MILKLILLGVVIWFGYQVYRVYQSQSGSAPKIRAQDMVTCDKCGIHLPASEALKKGDRYYCCNDHLMESD